MQIQARTARTTYDDIECIKECLDKGRSFNITAWEDIGGDEEGQERRVFLWLEDSDRNNPATIMFDLEKTEAIQFAKGLLAIAESL